MKYVYATLFFVLFFTVPFVHFSLTKSYWSYETDIEKREEIISNVNNFFKGTEELNFFDSRVKSHFFDVRNLVYLALILFFVSLFSIVLFTLRNTSQIYEGVSIAGYALIITWSIISLWTLLDFNSFFWSFHKVFFTGNFTFPQDNLVIRTFPQKFWELICVKIVLLNFLIGFIAIRIKKIVK